MSTVNTYANCTNAILTFTSVIASSQTVNFNAFLTDFSQTFASNWNSEEVFGRMDAIAIFKNTRRTISLAWDVPAEDYGEATTNLSKSNKLIKMLYPAYMTSAPINKSLEGSELSRNDTTLQTNAQSLSKPPLVKVKYANLIQNSAKPGDGLLGWIDNLNIKPVIDMGYFHGSNNLYPKVISISCNFNVLHQHSLGFDGAKQNWLGGSDFPF